MQTPQCSSCDIQSSSVMGAVEFPSVKLCAGCRQRFFGWLYDHGVMHGNPLVAAFWYEPSWIQIQSSTAGHIKAAVHGFKLKVKK